MDNAKQNEMELPRGLLLMLNAMKELVPTGPLGAEINGRIERIKEQVQDLMMQIRDSRGHTVESLRVLQSILETMKELTPTGISGERIKHEIEEKTLEVRNLMGRIRGPVN